jgi:predicted TIM-barrel fold metal-dependent hydrolase
VGDVQVSGLVKAASDAAPLGICDCHAHVFEDPRRFAYSHPGEYAPPFSPVAAQLASADAAGIARTVLVQPIPYGLDHCALLSALEAMGQRAVGIAVAGEGVRDATFDSWAELGVRGLRFVETRRADGTRMPGTVPVSVLEASAARLAERGWHAELWAPVSDFLAAWPRLERRGVVVVLDHMGGFDARLGTDHGDFQRLLALVREGALWIKLAVCRRAGPDLDYDRVRPFHDALIEANAARLVWASDFPFVRLDPGRISRGGLLALFRAWVPDDRLADEILIRNPRRLYRL